MLALWKQSRCHLKQAFRLKTSTASEWRESQILEIIPAIHPILRVAQSVSLNGVKNSCLDSAVFSTSTHTLFELEGVKLEIFMLVMNLHLFVVDINNSLRDFLICCWVVWLELGLQTCGGRGDGDETNKGVLTPWLWPLHTPYRQKSEEKLTSGLCCLAWNIPDLDLLLFCLLVSSRGRKMKGGKGNDHEILVQDSSVRHQIRTST